MIIIMRKGAPSSEIEHVIERLRERGYGVNLSGQEVKVIGAIGVLDDEKAQLADQLQALPSVERVVAVLKRYKLASREFHPEGTIVDVDGVRIGDGSFTVAAGPCSVESEEQILLTARAVREAGAALLRGGAFKPRTSPYDFQGLGVDGLKLLDLARRETGLRVVSEVLDPHDVEVCARYVDVLQIGARNMQNYALLREVGRSGHPVLLKRGGMYPTVENWLLCAEYVLREGNRRVILCERGLPPLGGETATRNLLDLSAVPLVHELSHLPVVIDPSHGTGRAALVPAMARGALAVGADGLLIEVHPDPEHARSDGPQSITPDQFRALMGELRTIAGAMGRRIPAAAAAARA
jgi:3-deoxy-7-phosphoheptulonate synthase